MEEVAVEIEVGENVWEQVYKESFNKFYLCNYKSGKAGRGSGPEYSENNPHADTHHPEWLIIRDLCQYDLRPNDLRDKIVSKEIGY